MCVWGGGGLGLKTAQTCGVCRCVKAERASERMVGWHSYQSGLDQPSEVVNFCQNPLTVIVKLSRQVSQTYTLESGLSDRLYKSMVLAHVLTILFT